LAIKRSTDQAGRVMPVRSSPRVDVARELAHALLGGVGNRLEHSAAVARRAEKLAADLPEPLPPGERELLVVAAWLHDVGYATEVGDAGFHPLDGARYLRAQGWPGRVCALVAHHSGARFAAAELGLTEQLEDFRYEQSPVSDLLTYADQTIGPNGQPMTVAARMAEMLARHGESSVQARIHQVRGPFLLAVADRVERRLAPV